MSITFRFTDDLHYVITKVKKEMGLLSSQSKRKLSNKKISQNQNFQKKKKKRSVGLVSFRHDGQYLFLDTLILDKRCQEQGTGKLVIKRLEVEARKKQKQAIYLYVLKHDQRAISMYQKYGFMITDQGRDYWVMEKEIIPRLNLYEDKFLRIHFPL